MVSVFRAFWVTLLGFTSLLPLLAVADLPAERTGTLAAVFPPGAAAHSVLEAVIEADGWPMRSGGWANVVIVHGAEAGFAGRLRRAGAWLVLDPLAAAGCLISREPERGA